MFVLVLVCLLALSAPVCAETFLKREDVHTIPQNRVELIKPDGMVANLEWDAKDPGHVTIVIDSALTDWRKVALSEMGFGVELRYLPPTAAETSLTTINNGCLFGSVPSFSFTEALSIIQRDVEGMGARDEEDFFCSNSYGVGTMDKAHLAFIPKNTPRGDYTLLCWGDFDDDGMKEDSAAGYAKRYYEELTISVRHTSTALVSLPDLNYVTAKMLAPMQDVRSYLTCEAKNGELVIKLPDKLEQIPADEILSQPNGKIVILPLSLNAPAGAVRAVVTSRDVGGEVDVIGGKATFDDMFYVWPEGMVEEFDLTVSWMDENGVAFDVGLLKVYIELCQKNLFPTYVDDWTAVSPDRINIHNNIHNLGVEAKFENEEGEYDGAVYITRDQSKPANGNGGKITATITTPNKDWKYYRIVSVGGSIIYGTGKQQMALDQIDGMDMQKVDGAGRTGEVFSCEPLRRYKDGPVDVYLVNEEHGAYGGGVWVIYWYDSPNAAEPKQKEWLCQIVKPMYTDTPVDVVNNENQLKGKPVNVITAIQPKGVDWKDWQLVIRFDPQPLLETRHYELSLVNHTGAYRPLNLKNGEKMVVYFPYPDGYDVNSPREFRLHHYNSKYSHLETLVGEKTAIGIRYELSSLSPFVLDWAENATPPKTGDPTPVWMLSALCVLCACAFLCLRRRAHA